LGVRNGIQSFSIGSVIFTNKQGQTMDIYLSMEAEFAIEWHERRHGLHLNTPKEKFDVLCEMFEVVRHDMVESGDHVETNYLCTYDDQEYVRVNYV